jgi:TonB family protein
LALVLTLASGTARSQQLPAAEEPTVVAPRLTADPGVTYPMSALKEHFTESVAVPLVLDVDTQGHVSAATVIEPQGHGFDEAAVTAARALVFEPATRDGKPVPARIKFRYAFAPPAPRLTGRVARQFSDTAIDGARVIVRDAAGAEHTTSSATDGTWTIPGLTPGRVHITVTSEGKLPQESDEELAYGEETNVVIRLSSPAPPPPPPVDGGAEPILDVVIKGDRPPREVTKRTIGEEEMEHSPGTRGDALLSLQNLPGVARPPPFSGALIVRGSAPQDTNIFIDGTNIPLVYHFGGLSSVVPTELINKIDFYPGNYSAMYGRGMGGVVDVGIRDPQKDGYHGLAELDLIDARLVAEGPIAGGWTFLAAGRRSWFDLWLGPILKAAGADVTVVPRYYDYQLEVQKDINPHSSFRLLFFGSNDELDLVSQTSNSSNPTFGGDIGFNTSFWRLQARYENKLSANTELRLLASYGEDSVDLGFGTNLINTTLHPLASRLELSQKILPNITANVGVDLVYEPYDLTLQLPPPTPAGEPSGGPGQLPIQSSTSGTLFLPGAYSELEIAPWQGGRIVPGLRVDYDSVTKDWDVAPRISARQDLTRNFPRTTLKAGVGVFDQPPTPMETDPRLGQVGLSSNRSTHYDLGVEQEFTREIDLSLDTFYKSFENQVEAGSGNSGSGFAYGVEWLLRYKLDKHFFGWISYTLSRSERRVDPTQAYSLFEFDQTHVFTILGSYKLGRGWRVGMRFRLTSGDLYTPSYYGAYDASVGAQLAVSPETPYGTRLPVFEQLDARVDKVWTFARWKLSWYLDVQNIYNAKNPVGISYNYNYTQSTTVNGLPILPILGLRGDL